jgi:antitoxin component of MazEF toxin-antitoxin module
MKAKLQKHFAYKYKDKKHYKHVVVIPEKAVNQLKWEAGQELELEVNNTKLIIEANEKSQKDSVAKK